VFGIGLGEILLIAVLVIVLAPRDIPRIMRRVGRALAALERARREAADFGRSLAADVPATAKRGSSRRPRRRAAPPKTKRPR